MKDFVLKEGGVWVLPNYEKAWDEFESRPKVGITGTRQTEKTDLWIIESALAIIPDKAMIVVGGCIGANALVAETSFHWGFYVHAVLPSIERGKFFDQHIFNYCHSWEEMPPGIPGNAYRERNQRIVNYANVLFSFPELPEDHGRSKRSGTWMTIRMARMKPIPVHTYMVSEYRARVGMDPTIQRTA